MIELRELFTSVYGVNLEYNKMNVIEGGIPFVARTRQNNGVVGFVEKIEDVEPNPAMTISLSASGSVMESFLQEQEYYSGRDLYYLKPKIKLSKNQMLYYCMILRANKYRYSFGRQTNKTLDYIKIPAPDEIPRYVHTVSINAPSKKPFINTQLRLTDREWNTFWYRDIFNISGTTTTQIDILKEHGEGEYPYVTTQAVNNGIEGFFNYYTEKGNVITIDSAVLGYCSYQALMFSASDHVIKLELIGYELNKYIAMFLVALLSKEYYRYSYGRGRTQARLRNETIKLPVDSKGNPDWQFMEDYIKSLPYSSNL